MSTVKVRIYRGGSGEPAQTYSVPKGILRFASGLIPRRLHDSIAEHGVDLPAIVSLIDHPEVTGTLIEVEDHNKNERVVVSLE